MVRQAQNFGRIAFSKNIVLSWLTQRSGFEIRIGVKIGRWHNGLTCRFETERSTCRAISLKENFMTLRRTLTGLALAVMAVMALALFMGCVETGPPPVVVMEPPPPPMPKPRLYFVNVSSLALREGPTTAAPQVGTLQFNDEVQILETDSGWARVGDVRRDRTGSASMRYLQPVPANRAAIRAPEAPGPGSQGASHARRNPQGYVMPLSAIESSFSRSGRAWGAP